MSLNEVKFELKIRIYIKLKLNFERIISYRVKWIKLKSIQLISDSVVGDAIQSDPTRPKYQALVMVTSFMRILNLNLCYQIFNLTPRSFIILITRKTKTKLQRILGFRVKRGNASQRDSPSSASLGDAVHNLLCELLLLGVAVVINFWLCFINWWKMKPWRGMHRMFPIIYLHP